MLREGGLSSAGRGFALNVSQLFDTARDNLVSAEDPILLMYAARYSKQVMALLARP
jgi:hypothetical protein